MATRIVGLVDCDSFYASCEKVFRPDWAARPLVVLSNNDGCVVARSAEAKALQIPMGEPYFRLRDFAKARGVVVRSANYALYGDLSRRVMQTLEQWTPTVDVYSIDEAFLDLSSRFKDASGRYFGSTPDAEDSRPERLDERWRRVATWPEGPAEGELPVKTLDALESLAQEIVTVARRWTGIPVSLGLGPNRTLAKVASRLAKLDGARTGRKYALLFEKEARIAALKRLPLEDVWGVGRRLSERFLKGGLRTAYDLARLDPREARKDFTIEQERTIRELRGECVFAVGTRPEPRKSMQISRSFGEPIESLEELEKPISTFTAKLAEKLRANGLVASGIYLHASTSRFATTQEFRCVARGVNLARPTNLTPELLSKALGLLRSVYQENLSYKRAGIVGLDLVTEEAAAERRYLFEPDPTRDAARRERERRLCATLDAVRLKFGKNAAFFASEGVKRPWSPNSSFISPCYTTNWNDLPKAS